MIPDVKHVTIISIIRGRMEAIPDLPRESVPRKLKTEKRQRCDTDQPIKTREKFKIRISGSFHTNSMLLLLTLSPKHVVAIEVVRFLAHFLKSRSENSVLRS